MTTECLISEIEEKNAEISELKASFKDAICLLSTSVDVSKYIKVLDKTQSQHLADVKADAVDSVLKNCRIQSAFGSDIMGTIDVISVVEYADKLRGETK